MKTNFNNSELSLLHRSVYNSLKHHYDKLTETLSNSRRKALEKEVKDLVDLSFRLQSYLYSTSEDK
jgi:hypothetical protein